MRVGFLMVISGPSGVGKGTVCEQLLKENLDIKYSISATSRKKRPNEENGKNYFFCSEDEFKKMAQEGKMLEFAKVHGNYYGTPKKFVLDSISQGDVVILEIDVQGAMQIKENYPDAVFVFLLPPNFDELKKRIVKRNTEDIETINLRMENAENEVKFINEYDYAVVNEEVKDTVEKIKAIIQAERLKVVYRK